MIIQDQIDEINNKRKDLDPTDANQSSRTQNTRVTTQPKTGTKTPSVKSAVTAASNNTTPSQDPNTVLRRGELKCSDHEASSWKKVPVVFAHGHIKYTTLRGKQATVQYQDISKVRSVGRGWFVS